jgi:quinolinate synthase
MCRFARDTDAEEILVGTEVGILYRLRKENPEKRFYPITEFAICENMKRINLEKILWSLEEMKYEVKLPPEVISKAAETINRMLDFKD